MADMNMMVAMLRGAFAALTDEQKREVLGDGYAPQPDLASTLADVTLDEVLEHSDIDSEDLIEQLEAEEYWVFNDIEDMAQMVRDHGKVVFDEDDMDEVKRWAKDNGYAFFPCEDEARRSLLNGESLIFRNASEAARWVFDNEDEVAVQGRSLASLAHQAGHLLFEDRSEVVEYVSDTLGKVVVSRPYLRKLREDVTLLLDGTLGVLLKDDDK